MDEDFSQNEEEKINPAEEKPEVPLKKEEEVSEKKEFLKREEIVTMKKDIAILRELEVQQEREKIATIRPIEEKEEREGEKLEEMKGKTTPEKEIPITLIPKILPKKPSSLQKILARAGAVLVIILIGGFFYWFFAVRPGQPEGEIVAPGGESTTTATTTATTTETTGITIPLSLIEINATETIEVANLGETTTSLSQLLTNDFGENTFNRIVIKNTEENKILGLKEFFEAFEIKSPEDFLDKLDNGFTLFLYSSKNINRLGFVAEIKETEGFADSAKNWEPTMEKDTETLFSILGKTSSTTFPSFRTAPYRGKTFRYISFQPANLGICWSTINNYFLWTSSGESMIKLIDKIQ